MTSPRKGGESEKRKGLPTATYCTQTVHKARGTTVYKAGGEGGGGGSARRHTGLPTNACLELRHRRSESPQSKLVLVAGERRKQRITAGTSYCSDALSAQRWAVCWDSRDRQDSARYNSAAVQLTARKTQISAIAPACSSMSRASPLAIDAV